MGLSYNEAINKSNLNKMKPFQSTSIVFNLNKYLPSRLNNQTLDFFLAYRELILSISSFVFEYQSLLFDELYYSRKYHSITI